MRRVRWASLGVAGGTLAALSVVLPPTVAQAAPTTLNIQVGGDSQVAGLGFEGMRFLAPPGLTVHKGDVINFTFAGFHTATLIPANEGAADWRQDNMAGITSPYSLVIPDTDDTNTFVFNNADALPSDPTCGTTTAPCDYRGTDVVNSGLPIAAQSFAVTVDANPGDSFWVLCLVHSDMQTRVKVVADNVTTTTQAEINAYASSQTAADREAAASMSRKLQKQTRHKTSSGRVWDAYAGYDGDGWSLDAMFPSKLVIHKGQTVRWHFTQLMGNVHTVSFPMRQASKLAAQFGTPTCEGANGGADTPPAAPPAQPCADMNDFELHIPGAAVLPAGGHKYGGASTGFRSSGLEGPAALGVAPYDLKFTHKTGKRGFGYLCIVHGEMMSGHVRVKPKG